MTQTRLRQEHRQQQTLTPRLQQAVRLLQLSSLDFAQEVSRAMESNPFLEGDEADGDRRPPRPPWSRRAKSHRFRATRPLRPHRSPLLMRSPTRRRTGSGKAAPGAQYGSGSRRGNGSDSEFDSTDLAAADQSLRDYLRTQMQLLPASPRDRALMLMIIEALHDDGYLRIELEELKAIAGVDPVPDDSELLVALRLVQSLLQPAGIAARDLKECLLLQLREFQNGECQPQHALATRIVSECLDRVAVRDVTGIARSLGASTSDVEKAFDCIRHLQPRPGWRYGVSDTRFITPDIIVRKVRDEWTVMLNPDIVPRVRLNRMYADLFRSHRDSSHADLAAQLQEARWTLRNVEQRFSTILRWAGHREAAARVPRLR